METQINFDIERDRYLMFYVGWRGEKRVYGCVIYIEIKEEKIWIQRDGTEVGIANELVEFRVSKSDIVLGYRSPYMRQFTELAVGYSPLRDRNVLKSCYWRSLFIHDGAIATAYNHRGDMMGIL